MSKPDNVLHEQDLDRLVDGELSDPERGALIRRIEDAEDGWRRCSQAFLEAQEWKRALAPLAVRDVATAAAGLERTRPELRGRRAALAVALAGTVVLAFVGGWASGRNSMPTLVRAADVALQADRDTRAVAIPTIPAGASSSPQAAPQTSDGATPSKPNDSPDAATADSISMVQVVGLMRIAGDVRAQHDYAMPVFAVSGADADWQSRLPLPYSDAELRRLRRNGYRVNQPLMRVDLADGRRLAIPFGTVQVQYVGAEIH